METIFALAARLQSMNAAEELALLIAKATLILLIARLLLAALPRASAATRHVIATAALVAVASMPLLSVAVPSWQIAVPVAADSVAAAPAGAGEPARAGSADEGTVGVRDDATVGIAKSLVQAIAPAPVSAVQRAVGVVRSTWKGFGVLAIALLTLAMLAHMLTGMAGVWFVVRNARELENDDALLALDQARDQLALRTNVRLLQSPRVTVPVVWGVFRPVLLLPTDAAAWPAERMRVVLLHELAHLKRVDGLSLILTRVAVSLFWFHPLAWTLERAGRNECERACDDLVLATGTKPSEYADHLLGIARTMPSFDPFRSVTLAMSRRSQLEGRLLSILQPGVARRVFNGRRIAFACAVAVAVIIPLSALRLIAQQAPLPKAEPQPSGSTVDVRPQIETLADYFSETFSTFQGTPDNAEEWHDHAFDLYKRDRYTEAAEAFRRAAAESERPHPKALYNAACSYALANDAARAAEALNESLAAGWDDFDKIAEDSDFDAIRDDPRFASVLARYGSDAATRRLNQALSRYEHLRGRANASSSDWHKVGTNLLHLRRFDEALDALQRSLQTGESHATTLYNIACVHALRGDSAAAIDFLDRAIENGYSNNRHMKKDRDLASVRSHPSFEALLRKADDLELRSRGIGRSWPVVAEFHERMTRKYPHSGRAWFNYGYASLQTGDYDTGIAAFRRTLSMGYRPGTSAFNIACAYALQENRDAAFEWLERAKAAGYDVAERAKHDDDLESLHRDARWRTLVAEAR